MPRISLRYGLGLIAGLFLFLQLGLVLRNGCNIDIISRVRGSTRNCSGVERLPKDIGGHVDTSSPEEKAQMKEARRIMSLDSAARLEFIERNGDLDIDHHKALLYGKHRAEKSFMTVGIPSIRRKNVTYLEGTVASLSAQASEEERKEIIVVVFLSDFDEEYKMSAAKTLHDKFKKEVEEGFLHIITAPRSFYPDLTHLERTFNDKEDRVKWRSKQNYDYAYLMKYSQPLAKYYMQLEDDVVTVHGYLSHVKSYITKLKKKHWSCLEFSDLGFIGKLFPSDDIGRLAKFLMMFFDQQPVDLLFPYFYRIMTQGKPIISRPSLFQHMGALSSFNSNKNPLKDRYFRSPKKEYKGDNPPANLVSNLEPFEDYTIDRAYNSEDSLGFFWGKTPKKGDTIYIVFHEAQTIDKIVIVSGSTEHPGDKLSSGIVEFGETAEEKEAKEVSCSNMQKVGEFEGGVVKLQPQVPFKVKCIRVTIGKNQQTWLIISEIAVFIHH